MFSLRNALILIAGIAILLIGGWLGTRYWLLSYLGSEACQRWLNTTLSTASGGQVNVARLQPQSLDSIYCEEVTLESSALSAKAQQMRSDVRFSLLSRFCDIQQIAVTRAQVRIKDSNSPATSSPPSGDERYRLERLLVEDFNLQWMGGELKRQKLTAVREARQTGAWNVNGVGGEAKLAGFGPKLVWRIEEGNAIVDQRSFRLVNVRMKTDTEGAMEVQGSHTFGGESEWTGSYQGLPLSALTDGDWRARLNGLLSGTFRITSPGGQVSQEGTLELKNGAVTALPVLDALASWTRTDRFRQLPLHRATARYKESDREGYTISEIQIESSGVMRIEGHVVLRNGRVEGTLQVGLTPGLIRDLPGGSRVFTAEREGYLWTPVTLSGAAASPTEDLTPRLVRAAAGQVLSGDPDTIRQGVRGATKATRGVIEAVSPLLPLPVDPTSVLPIFGD